MVVGIVTGDRWLIQQAAHHPRCRETHHPGEPNAPTHYSSSDQLAAREFVRQHRKIGMNSETGELVTVQAAADRLVVSRWMIYRLIWDNQLKSVQIGRCRRIVRKSLDDYVAGLINGAA
jgi:excisionase family DNA binding protein